MGRVRLVPQRQARFASQSGIDCVVLDFDRRRIAVADIAGPDVADSVERIAHGDFVDVADGAQEEAHGRSGPVAQRCRPEQWHEEIRPLRRAPLSEGDPEVLLVLVDAHHRRQVENPAYAHGRVQQHPAEIVAGLVAATLQHIVDTGKKIVDVAEEVRYPGADQFGHVRHIGLGDRLHDGAIDRLMHLVHRPIPRLERIVLVGRGRTTREQQACARKQQG